MNLSNWLPFWPDSRTFYVPWMRIRTEEGDLAEGPMMRQGLARREVLVWTDRDKAEKAARDLAESAKGSYEIKTMNRKNVLAACRVYQSWGSPVAAVILS